MNLNNKIEFLVGNKDASIFNARSFQVFDEQIIEFLAELSNKILTFSRKNKEYRVFSYFALWSRRSNLLRLKGLRSDTNQRFGRGISFHIAPSNVVTNILFTMAFGLISGCPSLIRISKKNECFIIFIM